jgi:hypothetical protein
VSHYGKTVLQRDVDQEHLVVLAHGTVLRARVGQELSLVVQEAVLVIPLADQVMEIVRPQITVSIRLNRRTLRLRRLIIENAAAISVKPLPEQAQIHVKPRATVAKQKEKHVGKETIVVVLGVVELAFAKTLIVENREILVALGIIAAKLGRANTMSVEVVDFQVKVVALGIIAALPERVTMVFVGAEELRLALQDKVIHIVSA